ncbi:MAG: type I glutamate--ammonia ligase [Candidatus Thermoplasmatota archaeon]|jgi:glutamine synthetase|nr:type I glutamate--ammonia ligase [Candidatus Thermoplasmatota archaeon]
MYSIPVPTLGAASLTPSKGPAERADAQKILDELRTEGIRWVELFYTDVLGGFNQVDVPLHTLDAESFASGVPKLDGSSVRGFRQIYDSDMLLVPDARTLARIPWTPEAGGTVRFICDVRIGGTKEGYAHDPRFVARKTEEVLAGAGYDKSYWGPEVEFFVFDSVELVPSMQGVRDAWSGSGYLINHGEAPWQTGALQSPIRFKEGYHRSSPHDTDIALRAEMANTLADDFHIVMDAHHHEVSTAGQGELNVRFDELVPTADHIQDVRYVIKNVARRHGKIAVLMPKPVYGDNGIGMHTNQSLWQKDTNAFYDANDAYAEVSQTCRYYVGGLLEHARSLCAITNPITNSYRRLVPGYEAPVFIAWSRGNRSANVRIPAYQRGHPEAKRIEYRTPDSAANIYLTEAALALAGLDGIKKKMEPPAPVDQDIYKLAPAKRRELGIRELPGSLGEALDCFESDCEFLKPAFASSLLETYTEIKRNEQLQLNLRPHPYEFYAYLDV